MRGALISNIEMGVPLPLGSYCLQFGLGWLVTCGMLAQKVVLESVMVGGVRSDFLVS